MTVSLVIIIIIIHLNHVRYHIWRPRHIIFVDDDDDDTGDQKF